MIMRDKKIIRQELKEKGFTNIRYSGKLQKFFAELNNKPHQNFTSIVIFAEKK